MKRTRFTYGDTPLMAQIIAQAGGLIAENEKNIELVTAHFNGYSPSKVVRAAIHLVADRLRWADLTPTQAERYVSIYQRYVEADKTNNSLILTEADFRRLEDARQALLTNPAIAPILSFKRRGKQGFSQAMTILFVLLFLIDYYGAAKAR